MYIQMLFAIGIVILIVGLILFALIATNKVGKVGDFWIGLLVVVAGIVLAGLGARK